MSFCTKVLNSRKTTNEQLLSVSSEKEKNDLILIEIQLFNDAMVDLEIKEIKLALKSSHNQNLPIKIRGIIYSITNEDQETSANENIFGDSTFSFLGRSYLNLTLMISQKDLNEIQEKYIVQDLLVIKLNDHKEILIKDGRFYLKRSLNRNYLVDYLNLKLEKNDGSGNNWAWFLVSLSLIIICIIIISIGIIILKRKRNFFEKLKITGDNYKEEPTSSDRNKDYANFNKEYEI